MTDTRSPTKSGDRKLRKPPRKETNSNKPHAVRGNDPDEHTWHRWLNQMESHWRGTQIVTELTEGPVPEMNWVSRPKRPRTCPEKSKTNLPTSKPRNKVPKAIRDKPPYNKGPRIRASLNFSHKRGNLEECDTATPEKKNEYQPRNLCAVTLLKCEGL